MSKIDRLVVLLSKDGVKSRTPFKPLVAKSWIDMTNRYISWMCSKKFETSHMRDPKLATQRQTNELLQCPHSLRSALRR